MLDPWTGSGTTLAVCSKKKVRAIGTDINPVMVSFANAKSGHFIDGTASSISEIVQDSLKRIDLQCFERFSTNSKNIGAPWKSFILETALKKLKEAIEDECDGDSIYSDLYQCKNFATKEIKVNLQRDFFMSALFITGRILSERSKCSNPTWTKSSEEILEYQMTEVVSVFIGQCYRMLKDVKDSKVSLLYQNISLVADSRQLPFEDSSFAGVITSPPYLTRIDYAVSTKPELLVLGNETYLRHIREQSMGSPVIVDKSIEYCKSWGEICKELISAIELHSTKSAKNYYLPNILQYFRDAEKSISEIIRVLKPGAKALLVVQSSYFKEIEIKLGDIYVEMAEKKGCTSKILSREIVKGHMAHVNLKSSKYKKNKVYFEDVVEVVKPRKKSEKRQIKDLRS